MSDFFSSGWSWFVIATTIGGLVFCVWLLFAASNTTAMADDGSTGHVYDDNIVEMNNPLPRWWLILFVITVLFSALYLWLYPGLGSFKGQLGWSQEAQYQAEQQAAPVDGQALDVEAVVLAGEREAPGVEHGEARLAPDGRPAAHRGCRAGGREDPGAPRQGRARRSYRNRSA